MIEGVQTGDYILLHTWFAIQKISEEEAMETIRLFEEFEELNQELDDEEKATGKRIT